MPFEHDIQQALSRGDVRSAYSALHAAAEGGDPNAIRELGIWFLEGRLVRRDLASSADLFRQAADLGDVPSMKVASAFLAVGVGGSRDWQAALTYLAKAATHDEQARAEMVALQAMALDAEGNSTLPYDRDSVTSDPAIFWVRGLLTAEECSLLIQQASPLLSPSVIIDPMSGTAREDPIRTSHNAMFPWANETPFIHAINRRIAKATGTVVENGEPLQILHYDHGQQYHRHSDALSGVDNQRVMTALIYLNDDFDGGETEFPDLGLDFRGRPGDMLAFANVDQAGLPHPLAGHIGSPVTVGEKWIASRWIREHRFG